MSERASARASFLLRRAHSLAGVLPLGVFLVEHLVTNASALYGRRAFAAAVERIQRLPALRALELVGIALPLAFHGAYGLFIARRARVNLGSYPHGANWLFALQRASGALALGFVLAHLWQFRVAKALGRLDPSEFYQEIERTLARPEMFAMYLLGLTATVFHFANGLRTAGETWGLTVTDRARRGLGIASAVVGVFVWALGVNTLYHFTLRCGGVLPLPGLDRLAACGL